MEEETKVLRKKIEELEKQIKTLKLDKLQLEVQILDLRKLFYLVEPRKESDLVGAVKKVEAALEAIKTGQYLTFLLGINSSATGRQQLERLFRAYGYNQIVGTAKVLLGQMLKRINQRLEQEGNNNEKVAKAEVEDLPKENKKSKSKKAK
jgi:hypothetical protein